VSRNSSSGTSSIDAPAIDHHAGIVDEHVDATRQVREHVRERVGIRIVGHVEPNRDDRSTGGAVDVDVERGRVACTGDHLETAVRELASDLATDAPTRSRDDGDLRAHRTTLIENAGDWNAPNRRSHSGRYISVPRAAEMSPRSMMSLQPNDSSRSTT
jgi:hypothetical protein